MGVLKKNYNLGVLTTVGGVLANQIIGSIVKAGEKIQVGEACYLASNKKAYRSYASADGKTAHDEVRFIAMNNFDPGDTFAGVAGPVTIGYSDNADNSLVPGDNAFLAPPVDVYEPAPQVDYGFGVVTRENLTFPLGPDVLVVGARGRLQNTPAFTGQQPIGYVSASAVELRIFAEGPRGIYTKP